MINKNKPVFFVLLILVSVTLACRLGRGSEPILGESYQSDEGGFIIQEVIGYSFEESFGVVNIIAPDAIPDIGPEILVIGGLVDENVSVEDLYEEIRLMDSSILVGEGQKAKVDGVDGLLGDLTGEYAGEPVKGKVLVALPGPQQQFIMMALAPEGRWSELQPIFDELLKTVKLIDATPVSTSFDEPGPIEEPEPVQESEPTKVPVIDEQAEVLRQWAVYAEASSEYTETDWSAMQATGEPDVFECGDDANAWASRYSNTKDHLLLEYETPVIPTELILYQTYNPSQVVEILFEDVDGDVWILWEGEPEQVDYCPHVWTHTIELYEVFYTNKVILIIDQSLNDWGWAEIDAVELVGYPLGTQIAQPDSPEEPEPPTEPDEPSTPTEPDQTPVGDEDIPTNYEGLMAGPIYQGWVNIIIGETMEADLDRVMTIEGRKSTDSWKPRESHAQTYLYDMPWDGMTGYISVTTEGWVYKKNVSSNTHPDDFTLTTVNRENYDELKAIYDRDKVIPYAVMANILESPGFLREQFVGADDGKIRSTYNWYNAEGDRIVGIFIDGLLTGMIGLNYIPAP